MKITKQDFQAYEKLRISGITNMFNLTIVIRHTGLFKEQITDIMRNYREYKLRWGKDVDL